MLKDNQGKQKHLQETLGTKWSEHFKSARAMEELL